MPHCLFPDVQIVRRNPFRRSPFTLSSRQNSEDTRVKLSFAVKLFSTPTLPPDFTLPFLPSPQNSILPLTQRLRDRCCTTRHRDSSCKRRRQFRRR